MARHQGNTTTLFSDRKRTNILHVPEQALIRYLVKRVPAFVTPNILTLIGFIGSLFVLLGFILASYIHNTYLLIGILGLGVNWVGDSLDGRIAYYRSIPRKWYGFSLDIIMDWISTTTISLGYFIYVSAEYKIFALIFLALYGWAMIISQLRYKITNVYTIDSGVAGPTEIRVLIALILACEIIWPQTIQYFVIALSVILFLINIKDTNNLLKLGDIRDIEERQQAHKNDPF